MDRVSADLELPLAGGPEEDRALISGYLVGSKEATAVIDGWVDAALRTAFQSVRDEWEDLRQEVRIRILRNLRAGRFNGDSGLRTYVHGIARNTAIDLCRSRTRRHECAAPRAGSAAERSVPAEQDRVVSRDFLEKVLDGVDDEDRRLLDLVHGQHLSYTEVARILGVAVGTIKARVSRCRQRLLVRRSRLLHREDD